MQSVNVNTKQAFESENFIEMMKEMMMTSFKEEMKELIKATSLKKFEGALEKAATSAVEKICEVVKDAKTEEVEEKIAKPQSAKAFFVKDKRDETRATIEDETGVKPKAKDVNERLTEMWNAMDDEEKAPYKEMFAEAKERYNAVNPKAEKPKVAKTSKAKVAKLTAKQLYFDEIEGSNEEKQKKWEGLSDKTKKELRERAKAKNEENMSEDDKELAKKKKDPNAPKCRNSYQIFYAEKKAEGMKAEDIRSEWSSLGEKDKEVYQNLAKKEKENYEEKLRAFVPEEKPKAKAGRKKSSSDSESDSESEKVKRPASARQRFFNEKIEENGEFENKQEEKEFMTELKTQWEELSKEEKKKYETEAKAEREQFKADHPELVKKRVKVQGKSSDEESSSASDSDEAPKTKKTAKKTAKVTPKVTPKVEEETDEEEVPVKASKKAPVKSKAPAKAYLEVIESDEESDNDLEFDE